MGVVDARGGCKAPAEAIMGRPESPVAVGAMLDAVARLVDETPSAYVIEPCVYVALQRLACHVATAIAAADFMRATESKDADPPSLGGVDQSFAATEPGGSSSSAAEGVTSSRASLPTESKGS